MRRSEILLGTLLVAIIAVIGITALLLWFRPALNSIGVVANPPATAPIIASGNIVQERNAPGYTAQMGYAVAQQRAEAWHTDARLLSTSATWPPGSSLGQILSGQVAWGFTFYAPDANAVAIVSVANNVATLVRQQPAASMLTPLPLSAWRIDSDDVIQALIDNGGSDFLQQEGASSLTITLAYNPTAVRVEWFISLIAQQSGHSLTMLVNAADGTVLEVEQIP